MNNYIFLFESDLAHYTADAFILRCIDDRFRHAFEMFLTRQGIGPRDAEQVAGGAKILSSPVRESDREFMLDQVALSIKLHRTKKIILATHHDCGAYGGFAAFGNNVQAELTAHKAEHETARAVVYKRFPDLEVAHYFIDEKGIQLIL